MTVAELIEELRKLNPGAQALCWRPGVYDDGGVGLVKVSSFWRSTYPGPHGSVIFRGEEL